MNLKCTIKGKAFSVKYVQNIVQVPRVQNQEDRNVFEEGRF